MRKFILTYGSYSGLAITVLLGGSVYLNTGLFTQNVVFGYVMMVIALVFLVIGMKQYRDETTSGSFTYLEGLLCGAGIAAVASIYYTATWEVCLYLTDYAFMDQYIESELLKAHESGQTLLQLEELERQLNEQAEWYKNFSFRAGITFMEMFPVGAFVSLGSAAILKNPSVLPRKSTGTE